jgi:acyl carrier protein
MPDVFSEIVEILAKYGSANAAELTLETKLEDINIESLDLVEIMFAIEERFEIEVPSNPNAESRLEFTTVGEIVEGVKSVLDKPRPA